MKTILSFSILLFSSILFSQTTLSGKIVDEKGNPVVGANIFIDGTYDGTSSNETGSFSFTTTTTGNQTLVVSFLIYETTKLVIDVANFKEQTIKLRESVTSLDAVVVTA